MEARAAEDAAAKAALVRDFPSLQPITPSPAAPHRKCPHSRTASVLIPGLGAAHADASMRVVAHCWHLQRGPMTLMLASGVLLSMQRSRQVLVVKGGIRVGKLWFAQR